MPALNLSLQLHDQDATLLEPVKATWPAPKDHQHQPLPIGHALQEYVVQGIVGTGGFGVVYLARDTRLERVVALKEYMPWALASRGVEGEVVVRSERQRATFELGLRSFVNEAQLLAAFDQPSLVKVYRFWQENGTAYMVMPYYEGPTLKEWLLTHGAPSQSWLQAMLEPMMTALQVMHEQGCYHRDIAPDNILLLKHPAELAGVSPHLPRPLLLDFGAARRVIGGATEAFTVILKPGYAPLEQYAAQSASLPQGAWTDVYALCAVVYACIAGHPPPPSTARVVADEWVPATQVGAGRYTPEFLRVIDAGLALQPADRPQSMTQLKAMLSPHADGASSASPPWASEFLTPTPSWRQHVMLAALGALMVVGLVMGGWGWWSHVHQAPVPAQAQAPRPVIHAVTAPDEPPAPVQSAGELSPPPLGVVDMLQDVVQGADGSRVKVQVRVDRPTLKIGKDRLVFHVKANEEGYVYVLFSSTDKSHLYQLFPNRLDKKNRIAADQEIVLPRKNWRITATGPVGTDHLVVIVSKTERDFSKLGVVSPKDVIPSFDLTQAQALWRTKASGTHPFAGEARCKGAQSAPCDQAYGATLFEIKETK